METSDSLAHVKKLPAGYRSIDIGQTITLPFHLFIDYLLGTRDKVYIDDKIVADLIEKADPKQELIHVQTLPVTAERTKEIYGIWRIVEWQTAYSTYTAQKEQSEKERQIYFKRKENVDKLTRILCDTIGLQYDEAVTLAATLYDKKQKSIIDMYDKDKEIEFV